MQKPIASWRRNKVNEINSVATPRFLDALDYAVRLHGTDVQRCTSIPYVAHLLGVCALALLDGGTEDEAIAAPHLLFASQILQLLPVPPGNV